MKIHELVEIDISRRNLLRGAGAVAATATMPSSVVKGLANNLVKSVSSKNLSILNLLLKIGDLDDLRNLAYGYLDSGIMYDALTDNEIEALEKKLGEDWQEVIDDKSNELDLGYFDTIKSVIGMQTVAGKILDVLNKYDVEVEDFFDDDSINNALEELDQVAQKSDLTQQGLELGVRAMTSAAEPKSKLLTLAYGVLNKYLKPKLPTTTTDVPNIELPNAKPDKPQAALPKPDDNVMSMDDLVRQKEKVRN